MPSSMRSFCWACRGLGLVIESQRDGYTVYKQCQTCFGRTSRTREMREMREMNSTYDVAITYCDGTNFVHGHEEAKEATTEYAELVLASIQDSLGEQRTFVDPDVEQSPDARHIRIVNLICYGDDLRTFWHIHSDVLPCEHNPVGAVT